MSSFDLCCPGGQGAQAPDSPEKTMFRSSRNKQADDQPISDEDSYGPPPGPPPPPAEPHPDDDDDHYDTQGLQTREQHPDGDKFTDEYDDPYRTNDADKGSDPPQETTVEYTDEEEADFEEDQSIEIPPSQVVPHLMDGDDMEDEKRGGGGGSTLMWAGCVACCLVIAALVLGIGFGTGAFTKEETSRSVAPPTNTDPPSGGGSGQGSAGQGSGQGQGTGQEETEPPIVINDPSGFSGLSLAEFIPAISLAEPEVFEDVKSPEYMAMLYLETNEAETFDTSVAEDRTKLIQMYSLLTLWYSSTDAWVDETGWIFSENECEWAGVTCEEGIVVSIDMNGNGLTGTLPPDIARLDSMRSLTLSNNSIMGPLPRAFFVMSNLEEVYLDNNLFDDELTDVSQLTGLKVFFASENSFSGDISVFWSLTQLVVLVLDDNAFSGTLNGISALKDMSK